MRPRLRTQALLLRAASLKEADVAVTLFTEDRGVLSAIARGARRSVKRFAALEPMHLLRVALEERSSDLWILAESTIERPRLHLVSDLASMEAAGIALRWVRLAVPPNTRDVGLWQELNDFLEHLDHVPPVASPSVLLAGTGLRLLDELGWGLELRCCVGCGRECSSATPAFIDAGRGGLVCRACGGGTLVLRPERRLRLLALKAHVTGGVEDEDARTAIDLVGCVLQHHAISDTRKRPLP